MRGYLYFLCAALLAGLAPVLAQTAQSKGDCAQAFVYVEVRGDLTINCSLYKKELQGIADKLGALSKQQHLTGAQTRALVDATNTMIDIVMQQIRSIAIDAQESRRGIQNVERLLTEKLFPDIAGKPPEAIFAEVQEWKARYEAVLKAQVMAGQFDKAIDDREFSRAREIARALWQSARTDVAKRAVLRAFSYPVLEMTEAQGNPVALSPDGSRLVTVTTQPTTRPYELVYGAAVWDIKTTTQLKQFENTSWAVFSPDGRFLAIESRISHPNALDTFEARLLNAANLLEVRRLEGVPVAFSPDSRRLVTAVRDQYQVHDMTKDGAPLVISGAGDPRRENLGFSGDSKRLNHFGSGAVSVWNLDTGQPLRPVRMFGMIYTASLSRTGSSVIVHFDNGFRMPRFGTDVGIWILGVDDPKALHVDLFPRSLGFFEGKMLASTSFDGTKMVGAAYGNNKALVIDAVTGATLTELIGHRGPVQSTLFSQDGQRIITESEDRTIRVWNATTGKEIAQLNGVESVAAPVLFSRVGDVAVTTKEKGFSVYRVVTESDIDVAVEFAFFRSTTGSYLVGRNGSR